MLSRIRNNNQILRLAVPKTGGTPAAVRSAFSERTFSSTHYSYGDNSSYVASEIPRTPLERHTFQTQAQLWEKYIETGEGVTELFDSLRREKGQSSETISAADVQRFLHQIGHKGIGDAEFHELDHKNKLDVKAFRSWARHATHDWSVHV